MEKVLKIEESDQEIQQQQERKETKATKREAEVFERIADSSIRNGKCNMIHEFNIDLKIKIEC